MELCKIAIIGGTGKAGRHIAEKALENGFQVRMLVRNPDKLQIQNGNLEIVKGDAESIDSLRTLLKDCQVVINTIGRPAKETPIYSSVTNTILSVMKEYKIKRYIGVTGASLTVEGDKKSLINRIGALLFKILFSKMLMDRKRELDLLLTSDSDWTLIRLPFIVEDPGMGIVKENLVDTPGTKISNRDIAKFIIRELKDGKYIKKTPIISN